MKTPDLSTAAMKKFFLYHSEKLILGISVLLLGLFCWIGWNTKPFTEKTPGELVNMADRADDYIHSLTSWERMKPFRNGEGQLLSKIKDANNVVNPERYMVEPFTGSVVATLAPRLDPTVFPVIEPHAEVFTAPVVIAMNSTEWEDPLSALRSADSLGGCLLYTSPSPRDRTRSRMPSSA